MEVKKVSVRIGESDLVFETGKIAKQTSGAVYAHYEGSAVIATVCCGKEPNEALDYVPLSVEYNENIMPQAKSPVVFSRGKPAPRIRKFW